VGERIHETGYLIEGHSPSSSQSRLRKRQSENLSNLRLTCKKEADLASLVQRLGLI
jgi:hypothetical protein